MKRNPIHNHLFVFISAGIIFLIPIIFWIWQVTGYTGGPFIYPVDDAYIHLEVAGNLATAGTWGINATEFGSASSSLLYTVLLSGIFLITGKAQYLPLIINIISGLVLLFTVQRWLRRQGVGPVGRLFIMLVLVFFTPLPVIALSGMEHVLQTLFSFLFLSSFSDWLDASDEDHGKKQVLSWQVLLFAMLMVTVRYENLFLLAGAGVALLVNKRFFEAIKLGLIASLPLIIFGIYSISKGSYFFPNSLMVKSEAARFSLAGAASLIENILIQRLTFSNAGITQEATQRLLLLLPLLLLVFYKQIRYWRGMRFLLLTLTGASLLQLGLADTGKFYRYEAYLIFNSMLVLCLLMFKYGRQVMGEQSISFKVGLSFLVFFLLFPFVLRSIAGFTKAGQSCINIYEQQYQMARLLKKHFNNEVVAANDIGAIAYFSNSYILDVWGLGNIEIAKSKKNGYWNPEFIDQASTKRNTDLVMVYESWLKPALPADWQKIATWRIFNNVVCGDDVVTFYSIDNAKTGIALEKLQLFQAELPSTVKVAYFLPITK